MNRKGFCAARIVTCDPGRDGVLGVVERGAVVLDGPHISFVGRREDAPGDVAFTDLGESVVTPGLVDAHTHACWAGSRHAEYAARMAGADYRTIAGAGGGILATHRSVSAASETQLADALRSRLKRMASLGVTTVEVKSGYGLEPSVERRQLAAIARVASSAASDDLLPEVIPTLLALHALPEYAVGRREAYIDEVVEGLLPGAARDGLARFVDLYLDQNAFTLAEALRVGEAARDVGFGLRLHVGQFSDLGGAELAAALGAASADHLEHVSPGGIAALAAAGVAAVLLPIASFTLGQASPPVRQLRESGVTIVVGSDANPGTSPTESLPLALALAVRLYGLTPEEALLAATRNAAMSLGLGERGVLREGTRADLVAWDLPHEQAIVQPWGVSKTRMVLVRGRVVWPNST